MKIKNLLILLMAAVVIPAFAAKKQSTTKVTAVNPKMMIVAHVSVKPDKTKDFIAAAKEIIAKSNQEAGCTGYQLFQDPYDSTKFVFVEEYKNQAAVGAHFATEHFKSFGAKIGDLVAGPPSIKIITVAAEQIK